MATFTWCVLGLLVASIAKLVAWDKAPIGWAPVMASGIVGAIGGGWLRGLLFTASDVPGFDPASLLMAIGGAAALVYLYYLAIGRKRVLAARELGGAQRRHAA